MGLFDKFKGLFEKKEVGLEDYMRIAEEFEEKGMFLEAINEYEKLIAEIYTGKDPSKYVHLTKKLIELNIKTENYERVMQLWPRQYSEEEYSPKHKLELSLILEKAGKLKEAEDIYNENESKLQYYKIEFLMRQKRIDDANKETTRLLLSMGSNSKGIDKVWMLKGKILMSIRRWEEAESYFIKVLEKDSTNLEAKKLKIFCAKQVRR